MQVRVEYRQSSPHTEWVEARAVALLSVVGIAPRRRTESAVDAPTNRELTLMQDGCPPVAVRFYFGIFTMHDWCNCVRVCTSMWLVEHGWLH